MTPDTLIQMRFVKRHQHYMKDDVCAFPLDAARQLEAMRVAVGVAALVPQLPDAEATPTPQRQPSGLIRK